MNLHEIYTAAQIAANSCTRPGSAAYEKISACSANAGLNRSTLGYTVKNMLRNTAASQTKNGLTFTVNADGSITVNGTASAKTDFILFMGVPAESMFNIPLKLSGCPANGSEQTYRFFLQDLTTGYVTLGVDVGSGTDLTISRSVTKIRCLITIYEGYTAENLTFYPMLRCKDIADDTFEPYKPSIGERLAALEAAVSPAMSLSTMNVYMDEEEAE